MVTAALCHETRRSSGGITRAARVTHRAARRLHAPDHGHACRRTASVMGPRSTVAVAAGRWHGAPPRLRRPIRSVGPSFPVFSALLCRAVAGRSAARERAHSAGQRQRSQLGRDRSASASKHQAERERDQLRCELLLNGWLESSDSVPARWLAAVLPRLCCVPQINVLSGRPALPFINRLVVCVSEGPGTLMRIMLFDTRRITIIYRQHRLGRFWTHPSPDGPHADAPWEISQESAGGFGQEEDAKVPSYGPVRRIASYPPPNTNQNHTCNGRSRSNATLRRYQPRRSRLARQLPAAGARPAQKVACLHGCTWGVRAWARWDVCVYYDMTVTETEWHQLDRAAVPPRRALPGGVCMQRRGGLLLLLAPGIDTQRKLAASTYVDVDGRTYSGLVIAALPDCRRTCHGESATQTLPVGWRGRWLGPGGGEEVWAVEWRGDIRARTPLFSAQLLLVLCEVEACGPEAADAEIHEVTTGASLSTGTAHHTTTDPLPAFPAAASASLVRGPPPPAPNCDSDPAPPRRARSLGATGAFAADAHCHGAPAPTRQRRAAEASWRRDAAEPVPARSGAAAHVPRRAPPRAATLPPPPPPRYKAPLSVVALASSRGRISRAHISNSSNFFFYLEEARASLLAVSYLIQGGSIASPTGAVYAAPCARGRMAETDSDDDDDDYDCAPAA
ncbi:hypothetical protein HU200_047381 [Digitaria exilis]|uniref:Uncharacterized protein n=1 Tax=Digitaria exilis TaxID=1010633 RepID=A0A835B2K1_9POAL|nr:hypothetical protein HU200_047381 [Digitaria exilis]